MRRLLYSLWLLGLLAGGSLVLPSVASAETCLQTPGTNDFAIAEIPIFQTSPEVYACIIPGSFNNSVLHFDLFESPTVVSDNLNKQPASVNYMVLTSEIDGGTPLGPMNGDPVNEVPLPCPAGYGPESELGGENSGCNGVVIPLTFLNGPPAGSLTVYSDIAPVPEPSTGLLLGAVLPALLGIRRRWMRVAG